MTAKSPGTEMHDLICELFPICRSITGDGFRQTLALIGERLKLDVHEVPTGTAVFDWTVPGEWNIRDAWVKDRTGRRVIDFRSSNLHVVSYSVPVRETMSLAELRPHLHTLEDQPDLIPYRTSYYADNWGFCLRHRDLVGFDDGPYDVCIDSSLTDGHLTYAEHVISGRTDEEILISCHACHPSLANDNLAGIAVAVQLAQRLADVPTRYSYRFLFVPGTIGSISWLAHNQATVARIRHGLVLACLGDGGAFTYKRSRRGDAEVDEVVSHVLRHCGWPYRIVEFSPYGYDERQYCSPGFDLPVGCLTRSPHGQFPEYHTSGDDLAFVRPECLEESLAVCWEAVRTLEANRRYRNLNPLCEPQLGRRGLYGAIGGRNDTEARQMAMLWILNLSDGSSTLLDVAERSGLEFTLVTEAAALLVEHELLAPVDDLNRPCRRLA